MMKPIYGKPKLICKVEKTHLPTAFPVDYYGMPDGNVNERKLK